MISGEYLGKFVYQRQNSVCLNRSLIAHNHVCIAHSQKSTYITSSTQLTQHFYNVLIYFRYEYNNIIKSFHCLQKEHLPLCNNEINHIEQKYTGIYFHDIRVCVCIYTCVCVFLCITDRSRWATFCDMLTHLWFDSGNHGVV